MLYHAYEFNYSMFKPLRNLASLGKHIYGSPVNPVAYTPIGRSVFAAFDVLESLTRRYQKPDWNLPVTTIAGHDVPVTTQVVYRKPFCNLVHFQRDAQSLRDSAGEQAVQPRVLLVAPMSGHYATLLRGTVEALLPHHEIFVTDWIGARQVPLSEGRFDLNDYIDYLIEFLEFIGPGAHVIGVCQPGPAIVSAVSVMSAEKSDSLPSSMTLMGSPIDTRLSPTVPNKLAEEKPLSWFKSNLIYTVPWPNNGFLRRVYPGFLQLGGFISMNQERHTDALQRYFNNLVIGDQESVGKHREFYDEYLAVQDLTEEFYLQTIVDVFREHKLPRGIFEHRGKTVEPSAIKSVALMTVEGELDDISGIGQTQAAHTLCSNIPESMRNDYVQEGVGHYGVFNGRRFREQIMPRMNAFYLQHYSPKAEKALRRQRPELE
ncbi:MAG: polyhydroxyalkanoate depolymerase, partial [Gammaproteobacteria bacterium]|nr:polyhydroxyalkanoate depolymerase [Gammaproteobacteria bacterium]